MNLAKFLLYTNGLLDKVFTCLKNRVDQTQFGLETPAKRINFVKNLINAFDQNPINYSELEALLNTENLKNLNQKLFKESFFESVKVTFLGDEMLEELVQLSNEIAKLKNNVVELKEIAKL